jgi:hypothetical protein
MGHARTSHRFSSRGLEYELNADFDLSLRPRWAGPTSSAAARQLDELALQFVLAGGAEDSVRLPGVLPEEFLASMERNHVAVPRITVRPAVHSGHTFTPFGWNEAAIELNRRYAEPAPHPPLETVRRANGRSFGAAAERELLGPRYHVGECDTVAAVESTLAEATEAPDGWLAKSNHSNAGLGNRRLRRRTLSDTDRRWLQATFAEDDRVVLEPWCRRVVDLCTTLELGPDGCVEDFAVHEIVNTAAGAFIGALFEPHSEVIMSWQPDLLRTAEVAASRLAQEGYFGPVCFDSFVWDDRGRRRLRPLADLNARRHMSTAARGLWRRWGEGGVLYWRMFSRRKLQLPDDHERLESILGRDGFCPDSRRGVFVASPLWIAWGGRRSVPRRLGVFFVGGSRHEVLGQESRFRERFER